MAEVTSKGYGEEVAGGDGQTDGQGRGALSSWMSPLCGEMINVDLP